MSVIVVGVDSQKFFTFSPVNMPQVPPGTLHTFRFVLNLCIIFVHCFSFPYINTAVTQIRDQTAPPPTTVRVLPSYREKTTARSSVADLRWSVCRFARYRFPRCVCPPFYTLCKFNTAKFELTNNLISIVAYLRKTSRPPGRPALSFCSFTFILFCLIFSLRPSHNSDPGSHSNLSSVPLRLVPYVLRQAGIQLYGSKFLRSVFFVFCVICMSYICI